MRRLHRMLSIWLSVAALIGTLSAPSAIAADAFSTWTPGPGAVGDNTYVGFIDVPPTNATVPPGSFQVAGWFVDTTAQGWAGADDVQVFQGTLDGDGKMLARATFAQARPDVAAALGNPYWAASGFNAGVPAGALAAGGQTLSVYVHTPGKGWWYKQVQVNVSATATTSAPAPIVSGAALPLVVIEKPADGEVVKTSNDYTIIGYALDRNARPNQGVAGSGIDRVQVYFGAERDNGGRFVGEAELGFNDSIPEGLYGAQFASSGWRLTFKPTQFHVNTYLMFAYARSAVSGQEDSAVRFFAIRD
ncbi:MAG: hypothetical protein LC797_20165 [Chloroflexi bacterium]|nr:hypothetical protein [Chloroflexota bacterium]